MTVTVKNIHMRKNRSGGSEKTLVAGASLAVIALAAVSAPAFAQTQSFDIDRGPAAASLNEFARQADVSVVFAFDAVEGVSTNKIDGELEPGTALARMLDGTGLSVFEGEGGAFAVRAAAQQNDVPGVATIAQGVDENSTPGLMDSDAALGSVTGGVKDERTGANLKGALIEIEETGQTTSTDDLGNFRFPSVRPGRYTLRISYLGYRDVEATIDVAPGRRFDQSFTMVGGDADDIIMVYGNRSARAQSLNQERTAANSTTVLSADILGNFNGTTISEALRRAPGVAFEIDPNTGDGANVILRGLEPDLNQIQLNGVRLLDGTGTGRSADLSTLLTESIESVTINKSLLPSQDSNGAGGLVEIETKSPLDRDRRFASFGAEYGAQGGDFGDDLLLRGTLSGIFGTNDDFGVSISAAYRNREAAPISYSAVAGANTGAGLGPYLPAGFGETGLNSIDPRTPFPFEEGVDEVYPASVGASQSITETETLDLNTSVQKRFGDHTDLRLDASYTVDKQDVFSSSTSVNQTQFYNELPIEELGGELRYASVVEDPFDGALAFFFGSGIIGDVARSANYAPDEESERFNLSLRGNTTVNNWAFDYTFGYTRSEQTAAPTTFVGLRAQGELTGFIGNQVIDPAFLSDSALSNTIDGRVVSVFAPLDANADGEFILPLFNMAGFDFYNDIDSRPLNIVIVSPSNRGKGDAYTAKFDIRRDFSGRFLKYVQAGVNFQDTSFFSDPTGLRTIYREAPGVSSSDLGLSFGPGILTSVGAVADFNALTRDSVIGFANETATLQSDGQLEIGSEFPFRENGQRDTGERTVAAYLEGRADIGRLEIIGGLRVENIRVNSTFFTGPTVFDTDGFAVPGFSDEFGQFITDSVSQTDILPRVLANYRLTENMLFRAGYFTTVSRPQLINLTDRQSLILSFDPDASPTNDRASLRVERGNPDLEPATTHNFSLDWEWYSEDIGVIKITGFYKLIENSLQLNRTIGDLEILPEDLALPDIPFFNDLPDPLFVSVEQPVNDDDNATIWGVEFTAERQFSFFPGLWSGFGVYTNYTYTDSSSTRDLVTSFVPEGFVEIEGVPFDGSPSHSGTAGLTFNKYGIDASLLYSIQSRRLTSFNRFFIHDYEEAVDTLDFRADYLTDIAGAQVRFFMRGTDLLKGANDPFTQTSIGGDNGVPKYVTGGRYFGGRAFFFGTTLQF